MIEYLEFVIEKDPNEEFVIRDGEGVRFKTGDAWFDSLDEKAASGENITLEDFGLPKEEIARLKRQAAKATPTKIEDPSIEEVSDSYAEDDR